ncbi:hypothetical protein HGRIS_013167 [Hohenbuehelia grisea]
MCHPDGIRNPNTSDPFVLRKKIDGSCTSTRVLLAFTWMCWIFLFCYFCFLTVSAFVHQRKDPKVWMRNVASVEWSDSRRKLASAPSSPTLPRFLKKSNSTTVPGIVAPRPRRVIQPDIYAYRSGLSMEYEIEHYNPATSPAPRPSNEQQPQPQMLAFPAAAAPPLLGRNPSYQAAAQPSLTTSFYPQYMQSALSSQDPRSMPVFTQPPTSTSTSTQPTPASPPPLGDWPRRDAITQPLRTKRRPPPPLEPEAGASSSSAPASRPVPVAAASSPPRVTSPMSHQSRTRLSGPTGPRTRTRSTSNGVNRPPPLDLSDISSHNERRR